MLTCPGGGRGEQQAEQRPEAAGGRAGGLHGPRLRCRRGLGGSGSAAGAARRPGPRATLRKLVFLRSARLAGYIVLLRWTGEVAAGLPAPRTRASRGRRLGAAAEWAGDGLPEGGSFALPTWPCPPVPKPKPLLREGAGQRGPLLSELGRGAGKAGSK